MEHVTVPKGFLDNIMKSLRNIEKQSNEKAIASDFINEKDAAKLVGKDVKTMQNRRSNKTYRLGEHFIKNDFEEVFYYKSKLIGL